MGKFANHCTHVGKDSDCGLYKIPYKEVVDKIGKEKEEFSKDWKELLRIISYLKNTQNIILSLEADETQVLKWYVDASFGTHNDMKSHKGSAFTLW